MNAQVAVGGTEQALQVVEGQGLIDGQGADDAQSHPLVDNTVQTRGRVTGDGSESQFVSRRVAVVRGVDGSSLAHQPPCLRAITVPKRMWRPPNPAANKGSAQELGESRAIAPSPMQQSPVTGTILTEKAPPVTTPVP